MNELDSKSPLLYLFGKMWEYSAGDRIKVILYLCLSIGSEIVNTFWAPLVMARIMNIVSTEGVTGGNIYHLVLITLLFPVGSALSWLFHGPSRYIEETNAFMARARYRECLIKGVMSMPLEWHNERHTGNVLDRIEKGASSIYEFSSESFQFLKPIIKLIGCFGAVVYFSNISALIVIAIMVLGVVITIKIDTMCVPLIKELSRQENVLSEGVHDAINNISTVITLRVEKPVFTSLMHKIMSPLSVFKKNAALNEIKWFLTSMCCAIMTVLVYSAYFYQHKSVAAKVSVGSFFLVVSYLDKISELFYQFTSLYGWTIRRKFRLQNGDELATEFTERSFVDHVLPEHWKVLQVRDLSFSYGMTNGKKLQHLDDVSCDIFRTENIAIVGRSGGGKTTFLSILRNIFFPQKGSVLIDGVEIPTGFAGISEGIGLVQQDPQIFERTIRENITLGAEYSDKLIQHYAEIAHFAQVVDSFPKKYDSMIKEQGVNLSGGEVQRLALTRALLASHDKDIVLLDEPTSSLDPATAPGVLRNIIQQFKDKTVIASIHSLQLLPLFDRVFVFDKGKIVGMGTPSELLISCPKFIELWEEQFKAS